MASGKGARFGGNKLMAKLGGVPLVGHVVRATDGLFDRRVVVTRHADVAALCEVLGVRAILHDEPGRNDTVRLGMEAMDGCDTVTFVQGDQPLIRAASIAALLRAAECDAAGSSAAGAVGCDGAGTVSCDAADAAGRIFSGRDAADAAMLDSEEDCSAKGSASKRVLFENASVNGMVAEGAFLEGGSGKGGLAAFAISQCDFLRCSAAGGGSAMANFSEVDCDCNAVRHIWRTSFDGVPGAPVLFPSWAFEELRSLPHGKGGGFVAKAHAECVRTIEVSSEWELFDVDTRDDLQQLQMHLARCGSAGLPR